MAFLSSKNGYMGVLNRTRMYANDPRLGFAKVVPDGRGGAQVVATAMLTDD